ncbi:quaternary ammonium compound efflux SMR transporter SugE [Tumidithrix elongata RA019]|uniref:Quaternary ammonium compound efflux SMR transporter SugE n=1 Tax=Tumidithrix elongata BACA0141 TaxID=2716417 RepID=A0AAW9Q8K2_9CYAN|nr:quaternary ammonium compound efflux SMR transporter SugE [Tumidithrix elongata RA019]
MDWFYLILAGVLEIVWATGLKYTDGFSKLLPSIGTIAALIVSFLFLAQALRTLPIGTGYAIWTGIGTVGTAIVGIMLFGESREFTRLVCIAMIILGIIGLKLATPSSV